MLILSYWRKTTYQKLLIGVFHKLISVRDVVHNMLHLHVAQQLSSTKVHALRVIFPTIENDADLNSHFSLDIFLNKILPDLLKLKSEAEKPDIQFLQHT